MKVQASDFLTQVRQDSTAWQGCLTLFAQDPPKDDVIRLVCLDIVNYALQNHNLPAHVYVVVKDTLMSYVQAHYGTGQGRPDNAAIQNKMTQTITLLFTAVYAAGWESMFGDFHSLSSNDATRESGNVAGTILYLRVLGSVHDEIADQLLNRTAAEQKRNTDLRDLMRERDLNDIAGYWQMLLSRWQQTDLGVVEMCLKNISRYVSWIDISLVVNKSIIGNVLEIAGQQNITAADSVESRARAAAIDTFTEIVAKKMKPADKIELIQTLQLADVVRQLISSPALSELQLTSNYDTDFAETVAKLVNNVVFDIVNALSAEPNNKELSAKAESLLEQFIPYMLRFFTDQYDEICCTIIPSLSELLTYFRKNAKANTSLPQVYHKYIVPILQAIIVKMKYDETSTWGEEDDQTDEAEFQDLRKRLYVLQQIIAGIDEPLFLNTLTEVVCGTVRSLKNNVESSNWRDVELALYELNLAGDLGLKSGTLYQKGALYCSASDAIVKLLTEVLSCGKHSDCCQRPLFIFIGNSITLHPHPAVQIRFIEMCVRYHSFFNKYPDFIPQVLDAFVILAHSNHAKVQYQTWNYLLRFVKNLKSHMAPFSKQAIQALSDLLSIQAEAKVTDDNDSDVSERGDVKFNSQIHLFEVIGCMASVLPNVAEQREVISVVTESLKSNYSAAIQSATERNAQAILQIHHVIVAWAIIAKGAFEMMPDSSASTAVSELAPYFVDAAECTIRALSNEQLNEEEDIRSAATFAFPRLLGILGSQMLPEFPRWIEGLLSKHSTKDEMSGFLRILDQVIYSFKGELYEIMNQFLQPLLDRVLGAINMPMQGTDDEVFVAELRREYLNLLPIMLNNNLDTVLISQRELSIERCPLYQANVQL